jgi:hypothetical protein
MTLLSWSLLDRRFKAMVVRINGLILEVPLMSRSEADQLEHRIRTLRWYAPVR